MFADFSKEELKQFSEYLSRMIATLSNDYGSPFDEDAYRWAEDFRRRMSEEEYERMMSMRCRTTRGFGFGRESYGAFGRGFGREDRRGFDSSERGEAPEDMPGAERFDPNYDGPMPEGRTDSPFSRKKKKDKENSLDNGE